MIPSEPRSETLRYLGILASNNNASLLCRQGRRVRRALTRLSVPALLLLWLPVPAASAQPLDTAAIGRAAGVEAKAAADGVVRVGWPRTDVAVTVDGVRLAPFAGLGSWAAFHRAEGGAVVTGDTVVFQDEVDAAIDAAFASHLEVTALHNHFFFDQPKVYFLHIGGHGDAASLAAGVKAVWDAVRAVRARSPQPRDGFGGPSVSTDNHVSKAAISKVLEAEPSENGGVLKFSWALPTTMSGVELGGSMGVSTWAAFSGSDQAAAVSGDFAMKTADVQPVLRALRSGGLHIVALHHHMVGEDPAIYFVHFWGKGEATSLASGVRAALDAQRR